MSSTLYWVTFVIVTSKIILNIFIAIILQQFQELTLKNEIFQIEDICFEQESHLMQNLIDLIRGFYQSIV